MLCARHKTNIHLLTVIFLAGLSGLAEADDSNLPKNSIIQPLLLTTSQGEEAKCLDMDAYKLDYCLHPADTNPSTPLHCYIDGKLVFECNVNGSGCKAHGPLKSNVKHPELKSKACPFLQLFKVPQNLLNHHYVCCTPSGTFHRYLQTCTDNSSAPSLPTEFQQLCGHQREGETENVHNGTSTDAVSKTTVIILCTVVPVVVVLVGFLKWKFCISRGKTRPQDTNNNQRTLEEGMIPKWEEVQEGRPDQQTEDLEMEPLSPEPIN